MHMNISRPEIIELLASAENKYGQRLNTANDFENFSHHLSTLHGLYLSVSTLKRLWGYVNYPHTPRIHTLDSLAQFIGYSHFNHFCESLKTTPAYNSSFISARQIISRELKPESKLEIGWNPNRYLRLIYRGDSRFEVEESQNSKIQKGDIFETSYFVIGQPLSLPYILRKGEHTLPFVAGRNGGLVLLNTLPNE